MIKEKVSFVIPVYNVENYLKDCIESILNQTYKNIEIILIDDGSKDNSYKIMQEYNKKYPEIIKIYKQKNLGAGPARNKGIEKATGEFLVFVDSDDYLSNDFTETMISNIQKNDIIISGFKKVYNQKVLYERKLKSNSWAKFRQMIIWAKMYRLEFLNKNNIRFEDIKSGQDVVFSFECYSKNPTVKIIDYMGYYANDNPNSLINNKKIQIKKDVLYMLDKMNEILNKNSEYAINNENELIFFYYKELLANLVNKAKLVDLNELYIFEEKYYNWIKNNFNKLGWKFKIKVQKYENIQINLIIGFYIISRKLHFNRLFVKSLHRRYYNG